MEGKRKIHSVLMFPWLAHGHISPFLELAKRLSDGGFQIYFCSTLVNLNSIRSKIRSDEHSESIKLVELELPTSLELPPHYHTTNGLPPHLIKTLLNSLDTSKPKFLSLLRSLSPNLIIYDFMQYWVSDLASSLDIPAVHFLSSSASFSCYLLHHYLKPHVQFPFPELSDLQECMKKSIDRISEKSSNEDDVAEIDRFALSLQQSSHVLLVKTFRELEGKSLDYLELLLNKKIVTTGPLVRGFSTDGDEEVTQSYMKWLDEKEKKSTVFVSFGSEIFLSHEDIEEIAYGLELSDVNFIWVMRFSSANVDKTAEDALPNGFIGRVGGKCCIIERWAAQARILGHESIGGFMSHCGWSSIMESLKYGVPIIAMPVHNDQPVNARLVEEVSVGKEAKRKESGGFEREEIKRIIQEVMKERDDNGGVMKKVEDMSSFMKKNVDKEINEAIEELIRLM